MLGPRVGRGTGLLPAPPLTHRQPWERHLAPWLPNTDTDNALWPSHPSSVIPGSASLPPGYHFRDALVVIGAAKWDWQRCHRGGERGEATAVIWHQEMSKKLRLRKNTETKQSPTFASCFGVSISATRHCPGAPVWCKRLMSPRCWGHGSGHAPFSEGGCPDLTCCLGDFRWSSRGSFLTGCSCCGQSQHCRQHRHPAHNRNTLGHIKTEFWGLRREPTLPPCSKHPPGTQRGPGTDPFIKVTAVGSAKQRRCDYFGELRELHWPDSHK